MSILSIFNKMLVRWRINRMLRRGLKLGKNVYIFNPGKIDENLCWLISIGDDCILSQDVRILAHDSSMARHLGYTKVGKVTIGCRTYIGAGTTILPGVDIGSDVIIGAGSVVTNDIPSNSVVVGNPARVIKSTSEFIEENKKNLAKRSTHLRRMELTEEDKRAIRSQLVNGPYYYKTQSAKDSTINKN